MKCTLLFIPAMLAAMVGHGQFSPPHVVERTELPLADAAHIMDVNGDGANDVIVCSLPIGIGLLLNEGNGHWAQLQWIDSTGFTGEFLDLASADVDGDGDVDLFVSRNSLNISYYESEGQGSFAPATLAVEDPPSVSFMLLADIDGDSQLDMVVNDQWGGEVDWYKGYGDGSFDQVPHIISDPFYADGGCAADLDGDGDVDVLSGAYGGERVWAANNGTGDFAAWSTIGTTLGGSGDVTVADLDADGDLDVLGGDGSGLVCWWANNGGGQFGSMNVIENDLYGWQRNMVADMDGDGDPDVLPFNERRHRWWANDGTGQFSLAQEFSGSELAVTAVADMDADGDMDVVELERSVSWFANDGNGMLGSRTMIVTYVDQQSLLRVADLDGDGDEDLVTDSQGYDARVMYYLNNGQGTFGVAEIASDTAQAQDLRLADIDGDGDLDMAIMQYGTTVWLANDGASHFSFVQSFDTPQYPRQLVLDDLDGDGDNDISYASGGADVLVRWNDGAGSFGSALVLVSSSPAPLAVKACDVDNDGDPDLLSCLAATDQFVWFRNNGNGAFDPPVVLWTAQYIGAMHDLICSDINGDGLQDFVYFSDQVQIVWRANLGGGAFDAEALVADPLCASTDRFAAEDVDSDGDADIIIAGYDPDMIYWHRNEGNGMFAAPMILDPLITGTGQDMFARDMDLDGDLDVAVSFGNGAGGERIQWYESFVNSPYHIEGTLYHDANEDGVHDANEVPLPFISVSCDPLASTPLTNLDGSYVVYADPGTYDVGVSFPNPWWGITTSPATYSPTLTALDPVSTGNDFGYAPVLDTTILVPGFIGNIGLCGATTTVYLTATNLGTTRPSGTLCALIDSLFTIVDLDPQPTSAVGNLYCWDIDSLPFYSTFTIAATVVIPDASYAGTLLMGGVQLTETDGQGNVLQTWQQPWATMLSCSYDPNHKEVEPKGYGAAGAVDIGTEELQYTIHFQNTGNAPAQNVMLVDRLADGIDVSSIEVLGYSHPPSSIHVEADRDLVVRFDGIQLPDSGATFTGSQGFFRFTARLNDGLSHGTVIENTADIYFDLNPAVITNTTTTTLVDCDLAEAAITPYGWNALQATEGDAYQWFLNDLVIPDATGQVHIPTSNGEYTVRVTSDFGCETLSDPYPFSTLTITDPQGVAAVLYPDPFTTAAWLQFVVPMDANTLVEIIDVNGRVAKQIRGNGSSRILIPRGDLGSGLYTIIASSQGRRLTTLRCVVE